MKHKPYKDQFTPYIDNCDLSFDGLDMSDKGHLIEHLAPIGSKWIVIASTRPETNKRIWTVDNAILKCMN